MINGGEKDINCYDILKIDELYEWLYGDMLWWDVIVWTRVIGCYVVNYYNSEIIIKSNVLIMKCSGGIIIWCAHDCDYMDGDV